MSHTLDNVYSLLRSKMDKTQHYAQFTNYDFNNYLLFYYLNKVSQF